MTPDPISTEPQPVPTARSTDGMTTKVVKGSIWTLAGQVAPLGVSIFTTPFVIRMLGAEGYGVLILVGLIPSYFAFADFGMSIASTKFASEAYAAGDNEKEARTVRTAALISLIASIPIASAIIIFSNALIAAFNVPENLQSEASLALKLASFTFVISFLNGIFNTPQLTRLRMDLNTFVTIGFRTLGLVAVPVVVYFGGGIVGAILVWLTVSMLTLLGHILVSGYLLKELFHSSIERSLIRPILKFGGTLVIGGIAALLLSNLEKLVLTKMTTVETLAYYSAAFTFAGMVTMFSGSMIQSLLPAFSQLQSEENRIALNTLYSRGVRINLIWLVPAIVFLALVAQPFFTIWGGEDFGRESPMPFYILLFGLAFNVQAYLPYSALMAAGRSDIFAKVYWIELVPYILLIAALTAKFGASGAAAAWSIRVIADAAVLFWLTKKVGGVSFTDRAIRSVAGAFAVSLFPFAAILYFQELNSVVIITTILSIAAYALVVWKVVLEREEIAWFTSKLNAYFAK